MPKGKSFTVRDLVTSQIILALIIGLVFMFINPSKKLEDVKNKTKLKDIETLQTAINKYASDRKGNLPPNFISTEAPFEIKKNDGGIGDICSYLFPRYLPELPVNPDLTLPPVRDCSKDYATGYFIFKNLNTGDYLVSSR